MRRVPMIHCRVMGMGIVGLALSVSAETWYLSEEESTASKNAWTTSSCWTNAFGGSANAFSASDDYVVIGKTLRTKKVDDKNTWFGKSLTISGTSASKRGVLRQNAYNDTYFQGADGLILGNYSSYNSHIFNKKSSVVFGNVSIAADCEESSAILGKTDDDNTSGFVFTGQFSGAAGTFVKASSKKQGFTLAFDDTSSFCGTFAVEDGTKLALQLGGSSFPGTLKINSTTEMVVTNSIDISNLCVQDGAKITIGANVLAVSGTFEHGNNPVPVVVDLLARTGRLQFVVGRMGAFTLDDFVFFKANGLQIPSQDLELAESDGGRIAIQLKKPRVTVRESDIVTIPSSANFENPSSLHNASNWTDGCIPESGKDYFLGYPGYVNKDLVSIGVRTPYTSEHITFAGDSLTLYDGGALLVMSDAFSCNLRVVGSGGLKPRLTTSIGKNVTLEGMLNIESGTLSVCTLRSGETRVDSAVCGFGAIEFYQVTGSHSSSPRGRYYLASTNESFKGSVRLYSEYNNNEDPDKITPRFDRNYVHFYLNDARALGGPLDVVNRKSFSIEDMSCVFLRDSASLDFCEPTRGIYIGNHGRFCPNAGESIRISSPLAVNGTLWKEGDGLLTLANPAPAFGADANSEIPDEDASKRMFRVSCGDVRIAAVDAVNGLDVVFTNGAGRILFDILSASGEMAEFGIRNDKTISPFSTDGDLEKIDLVLDSAAELPPFVSNGVYTVKTEAYATTSQILNVVRNGSLAGGRMSFVARENGDDTTTLVLYRRPYGYSIVVR